MPKQMFSLDLRDMRRLEKFMRRFPKQLNRATAGMLNSFAFGTRQEAIKIIERRMIVRNPRFVKSSIRVEKARGNVPINQQVSATGSIERARFTGWIEQEKGEPTERGRVPMLFARGEDPRRQVRPSLRMKSSNQFMSPDDFPGRTAANRVIVMLQILGRKRHRRPFIIRGHPRFKRGLYQFRRRKLKMVQTFEPGGRQPRRVRWLSGGRKQFFGQADMRALWAKNLDHVMKRARRK